MRYLTITASMLVSVMGWDTDDDVDVYYLMDHLHYSIFAICHPQSDNHIRGWRSFSYTVCWNRYKATSCDIALTPQQRLTSSISQVLQRAVFLIMTISLTSLPYYISLALLALAGPSVTVVLFLFIVTTLKAYNEHGILPRSLPWSGKRKQLLASLRANIRGATQSEKLFTEGYYKVCPG